MQQTTTSGANPLEKARQSTGQRIGTIIAIFGPFLGLLIAIYFIWGWGFSWVEMALLAGMYAASGFGITIGFHRLFTHRSFETYRPLKALFAVLGSMAVEGSLFRWVATHRRHHQHSDESEDPHSPHHYGSGFFAAIAGCWHAHVGWIFKADKPGMDQYIQDLRRDGLLRGISKLFGVWVTLGLLIPAIAGGLITRTWTGVFLGFLWGGLVRVFLIHHVTWSINSVCHLWGTRPFECGDESRNNFVCGILAFGEGWHNNHHAFPNSARHGLRWWQLDLSFLLISLLEHLGLAWRVRVPARELIATRSSSRHFN